MSSFIVFHTFYVYGHYGIQVQVHKCLYNTMYSYTSYSNILLLLIMYLKKIRIYKLDILYSNNKLYLIIN